MTVSPRRLRVAIDVTPAARQSAGIGRYARELAGALIARGNHDYVPFVADVGPTELRLGDVTAAVRRAGLPARLLELAWHRFGVPLAAERWTGPVDLFHGTDFLAPHLRGTPSLITVHDLSFLRYPERAAPGIARHLGTLVPKAVGRAAHVLADSESTRSDLVELLGVNPERITVAYPGVRPDFGASVNWVDLQHVRDDYGLPGRFLLGVGTLEPRKNWPQLIAAFEAVAPEGVTLAIAGGRGWGVEAIEAAAWHSRAPVRLLDYVPEIDLPALYHAADAFAYVSAYEGFGLPALEAMMCGVPCLLSDASSLPEVAGDAALLVPAGDSAALRAGLRRILKDEALRGRLKNAGPSRAAEFTWDRTAAAVEGAYGRAFGVTTEKTAERAAQPLQ